MATIEERFPLGSTATVQLDRVPFAVDVPAHRELLVAESDHGVVLGHVYDHDPDDGDTPVTIRLHSWRDGRVLDLWACCPPDAIVLHDRPIEVG